MKLADLRKLAEMLDAEDSKPEAEKEESASDIKEDLAEKDPYSDEAVKCAAECLVESERIKDDVKLMALVEKELRKQKRAIGSIQDLKDRYVEVTIKAPKEDALDEDGNLIAAETSVKRVKDDGEMED